MIRQDLISLLQLAAHLEKNIGELYRYFARSLGPEERRAKRLFTRLCTEGRARCDALCQLTGGLPPQLELSDDELPTRLRECPSEISHLIQEVDFTRKIAERHSFPLRWALQVARAIETSGIGDLVAWMLSLSPDLAALGEVRALSSRHHRQVDLVESLLREVIQRQRLEEAQATVEAVPTA